MCPFICALMYYRCERLLLSVEVGRFPPNGSPGRQAYTCRRCLLERIREREEGRRCSVGMVIYLDGAPRCRYHHCLVLSRVLRTPSYKASKVTWQIQIIFSMAMAIGREVSWCNFGLSYLRRNVMTGRQVFLAEKSARLLLSPGGRVGKLTSLTMCCKCPIDSDSSTTG